MRIGELAARAEVSVQAVRLYERLGIVKPAQRLQSGYRDYGADAVALVRFIKRVQQHGFTLKEIKSLIELREARPDRAERARALAQAKIDRLDEQIKELEARRNALAHGLNHCRCSEPFPICLLAKLDEPKLQTISRRPA
jgi:DNA-binding transcriptional MerR regulator